MDYRSLHAKTVADLRQIGRSLKVKFPVGTTKARMIEMIFQHIMEETEQAAQEQQTEVKTVQTQSPPTGERATTEPPSDVPHKSQFLREHVQFVKPMDTNSATKGIKI